MNKNDEFIVIAVKDELTSTFLQPTFIQSIEEAKRVFKTQINTLPIWKDNPSDFSLYRLGYYNQDSGVMTSDIEKIISGHSVREGGNNDI